MKAYLNNFVFRIFRNLDIKKIISSFNTQLLEEKKKAKFYEGLKKFRSEQNLSARSLKIDNLLPFLNDKTSFTSFDPHYIYHPAWAARILSELKPEFHIDISSTVSFCSIVSAFIPVKFYDYRPANIKLSHLTVEKADLMCLPFATDTVNSISCMHTVEHIGLGRYGDPIDFDGDIKAMKELARVLAPGGNLLFVVPVGIRRIEFNAHRIYSYEDIIEAFSSLNLVEFSLIPDDYESRGIILNPDCKLTNSQNWGCGCFLFSKK